MFRKLYLILTVAILAILAITPAYASSSLSLGSNASYNLAGKLVVNESCTAVPSTFAAQACSSSSTTPPSNVTLTGAGSTFVAPLFTAVDSAYTSINPGVRINYLAVGSGAGVNDLSVKTVDFATSDAPLVAAQIVGTPNTLTIPDTIGAVVVGYNLPGIPSGLKLNATLTAEIFQGEITSWNDPQIQALNPSLTLPSNPILIVHRSDSSGTTFVFSGYLSSSSDWKLGQSKTISWPASSIGANGNMGVAAVIQGTRYSVGYVELDYALSASPAIAYASLWNPTGGTYVAPSLNSTEIAVSTLPSYQFPPGNNATLWQTVNLLNEKIPGAYPIVSFSYMIVYQELDVYGSTMNPDRASALVQFLSYVVNGGQSIARYVNYVPLPPNVITVDDASISSITYLGQPPSTSSPPPVAPPTPTSVEVELLGTIGWNVQGLNSAVANLLVSHQVSVSIPFGLSSFTPITETGSYEQSINLSTRVESPGTATSLIESYASSLLPALSATGLGTGAYGTQLQNMFASQSNGSDYTQWWVNGPLSNGSPVQILNGYSSVTSSESLNLGGNIGTRSGWVVTSQLAQTFSLTAPNPGSLTASPSSTVVSANVNLLWSFDKTADLLLRNNDTATVAVNSVTPTVIYGTSASGTPVTVTRNISLTLSLGMQLSTTNLNLTPAKGHSASTFSDMFANVPWMPVGLGAIAAGAIGGLVAWLVRRTRKTPSPVLGPTAVPPTTPAATNT